MLFFILKIGFIEGWWMYVMIEWLSLVNFCVKLIVVMVLFLFSGVGVIVVIRMNLFLGLLVNCFR